jgi:hypothetical protein
LSTTSLPLDGGEETGKFGRAVYARCRLVMEVFRDALGLILMMVRIVNAV